MSTTMIKDKDGNWAEVPDANLSDWCKKSNPFWRDPAFWTSVVSAISAIGALLQATSARNKALDAREQSASNAAIVTDVKKEVQAQLPALTGRPPVTPPAPQE